MQKVSRLIDQFIPTQYELSLDLERKARKFNGTVSIHGELTSGYDHMSVHAKELTLESIVVDGHTATFTAGENDEIAITMPDFKPGKHIVTISFHGIITDGMHGLYPCYYEENGVKKELLATQFESHHAREVFPCIDEPEAKATFDVSLTTEPDISVLGNMPVSTQRVENGKLLTVFDTTPRMSTYLLAFVTGDLQHKTGKTKDGVEVAIWATKAQPAASLDFALETATKTIEFYNDFFDTPYPLPKSDHVALPDFTSGAMENWGLVTYREVALLADPKVAGISTRQHIALVVAHELAHMWFGNLVTMKWWDNLWLNESFASLMEYLSLDTLYPSWKMWLEFAASEPVIALRRDAIDGVQPVQVDVSHPDEISTLFDGAIVYAKGNRLLRMLQYYVGTDAFQRGLKQYFKDFAYKNTVGDDLWKAIAKASGQDIVGIMNTWISQPGYPVVHMTRSGDTVTLTQEQFFIGPHQSSDALWPIPLNAGRDAAPKLMTEKTISFTCPEPVRLNVGDSAHFITHYDDATMKAIIDALDELDPIDRLPLLHEATLLTRAGSMPTAQLIPLINAYKNETNEQVWGIISIALAELRKFVEDNPEAEKKLRELSGRVARKQYERLGWEAQPDESEDDTKLRSTIIGLTLYSEDPDALAKAKEYYQTKKLEELDPELRPLILASVARYGDSKIVDELLELHRKTASSELKNDICFGITSTRVPESIDTLLAAITDAEIVRPQDSFRWFVYLIRGRESRVKAWQWVRDNWEWVSKTFEGDKSYDDYPRYAATGLMTRKQLQEYKDFFEPKKEIVALTRVITMGISEIEGRVELIERDKDGVQKALLEL
jgi:aminopeptidase N